MEILASSIIILLSLCLVELLVLLCGGIARVFGISFRRFVKKASWLLLLPPLLFAYGALVERNLLQIKEVVIESPAVPQSFDGFRIVQISDLHLRSFASRQRALRRAVYKINTLDADLVIFSGDLVTMSADEIAPFADILSELKAKQGVCSVMGNHDYLPYDRSLAPQMRENGIARLKAAEASFGWTMLDNSNVNLSRGEGERISIIGIENLSAKGNFHSEGDLDQALEGADGGFKILISHDPSAWDAYIAGRTDIDLTLSGHTHNMQVAFFGHTPSALLYPHHSGLYVYDRPSSEESCACYTPSPDAPDAIRRQYLYVNTGLGETVFPARIGVLPEITLIRLKHCLG